MATSLTTEEYYNGTGSQTNFAFTFPYFKEADVKVEHPIGTVLTQKTASAANDYEFLTGTTIKFTSAPASGTNNVKIYRDTDVDSAKAIFSAGSSIRASDLNTNIEQLLFSNQDKIQAAHITANTITNTEISDTAEIEVSKLKDGAARQVLQTDAAGTGVEWTSNIDIPGSLDVTGNADIDGALNVDGTTDARGDFKVNTNKFTVAAATGNTVVAGNLDVTGTFDVTGTSNYTGQQTVPGGALVKDIRVGLDGNNEVSTASGNLILDSASGTVQITDHFNVTGNADVDANLNVDGTLTVDGASTLTGNVSVGGTVDGRDIAADGTKLDGIESNATADQTAAEIRTLVEAASDSNVFTDADHSKLNAIEAGATADQTNAEIRAAVEAATDSNVFTDADHSKLNAIEASATADQTAAEIRTLVEAASDSNVFTDADHSKLNAIEASATADQTASEIKTLYESNANTNALTDAEKAVIDGVTANTSELNTLDGITASTAELNITTGMSKATSLTSTSNTEYPTSKAVNDRIIELMQASGGFFPIADDQSFPNANPDPNNDAGTIVSIADAGGLVVNGSGVTTTGRTLGGSTVTINGIDSSLYNTTIAAGKGMLVQTTSTLNTYTYHRLTLDEGGVASAQTLVNDFNQRYRIGPSNPTSSLDDGDLFFNTTSDTMLVYNATASNWDEVQTRGNYFINTLSSFSGTGGNSASFNGSAYKFGLSHAGASAQQHLVSINGVLQKPNAGSSVPSEGFALDGSTIIFSTAPPAGSDYFIVTIGASVNIGTPSNNSVTSAMIVDGSIVNGDISNSAAIASSKLAKPIDLTDNEKVRFGTGNDLEIYHSGSDSFIKDGGTGSLKIGSSAIWLQAADYSETMASFTPNGAVDLYYDNSKKFETTSAGVNIASGNLQIGGTNVINSGRALYNLESLKLADSKEALFGSGNDFKIRHDGVDNHIASANGDININVADTETAAVFKPNNSAELYYDNAIKVKTTSAGIQVFGNYVCSDNHKLLIGNNEDLQIYHNGTYNTFSGANFWVANAAANETLIYAVENGAAELWYDNVKKLETSPGGGTLTGNWIVTNDFKLDNGSNAGRDVVFNASNNILRLEDYVNLGFGNGEDLVIWHDGTNSFIRNTTGYLELQAKASEAGVNIVPDGTVKLYYDGSKKIETTSGGAKVSGNLEVTGHIDVLDNVQLKMGHSDDLLIYHDGSNSFVHDNGTGELKLAGSVVRIVNANNTETQLKAAENGAVELYHNNSKKFETTSSGATVTGGIIAGGLTYPTSDGSNGQVLTTNGSGALSWTSTAGGLSDLVGDTSPQLGGDLDVNGKNILFANSSAATDDRLKFGGSTDLQIYHTGSHSFIIHNGSGHFYIKTTGTDEDIVINADRDVFIQCSSGENALHADKDGGVKLYYNNAKKFETWSNGIIVQAHEGGAGYINLYADEGDDNADKWRFAALTDGYFELQNYASGSWEKNLRTQGNGHVSLYCDASKKFETTSTGIEVTGNIDSSGSITVDDDEQFIAGNSSDLKIYHTSSDGNNRIDAVNGHLYLRVNSTENAIKCTQNGNVEISYNGVKKLETTSNGINIGGQASANPFDYLRFGASQYGAADIRPIDDGSHKVGLSFYTDGTANTTINPTEALRIDSGGSLLINSTSNNGASNAGQTPVLYANGYSNLGGLRVKGGDDGNTIYKNGGDLSIVTGDSEPIILKAKGENSVKCNPDAAVELYYDNSKKFNTNSAGVAVHGHISLGTDNYKIKLGTSEDLQIYHNGSHSYIHDNGTGGLLLRSNNFHVQNAAGTESIIHTAENGSVDLYYDNSKKLETRSYGVKQDDSVKHTWGNSDDLQIYHDGSHSYIDNTNNELRVKNSGWIKYQSDTGHIFYNKPASEVQAKFTNNGSVELYHNNVKKFETTTDGAKVTGDLEVTGDITGGVGKILQVITNTITGAQSGTNNSDSSENTTDLTGFSLNITPSSTSSKILLMATISQSSTNWSFMVHAYRDSTIIAKGDDLGGNRSEFTFCIPNARDYNDATGTSTVHIIDSPSTTSQVTYKLKGCTRGSNSTWHINRSARYNSYNSAWIHSTVSTFTLMEIG